ncbi:hypothetical protein JMJ35_003944 [Cladonia borealis]|uniref:Uncharacterized protein n=1 Tax=Cladonia borealis TaxID=184061 RepID=A0AA39R2F0_9LECA|nr:hypothetical protein JMJ35_003944 [Cladonia borealis]
MCPIGVDQTERGPQRWQFVVPRLKQNQQLPLICPYQDYKLLFDENGGWDAWSRLARPAARTSQTFSKGRYYSRGPVSRLESFPAEILAMILSCSELSEDDIIALGMASETLWSHTIHYIDKEYRHSPSVGPWAGCEIACVGSYLTELPPSFDKDDLALNSVSITEGGWMCIAREFNWAALSEFTCPGEDDERKWRGAFTGNVANQTNIPKTRLAQMSEDLLLVASTIGISPADAPWILRNLTTKEFVRCLPRADSKGRRGYVDHPEWKGLHVNDVLTMRICWTRPHRWDTIAPFNMCGQWAGHSFDIVALDDENRLALSEAWVDVTDAIVEEANKHIETLSEDER